MLITRTVTKVVALGLAAAACLLGAACGSSSSGGGNGPGAGAGTGAGGGTQTGQSCSSPSQCYPGLVDGGVLKGTIACLTVTGGYCTHTCQSDADCCAIQGECGPSHPQVCAPFQSTGQNYCFLSCEAAVVGSLDATTYCKDFANSVFGCRSTGGGKTNKQVCLP